MKDDEIKHLSNKLNEVTEIANNRLLLVEKANIEKASALSTVADAYSELEKIGIDNRRTFSNLGEVNNANRF